MCRAVVRRIVLAAWALLAAAGAGACDGQEPAQAPPAQRPQAVRPPAVPPRADPRRPTPPPAEPEPEEEPDDEPAPPLGPVRTGTVEVRLVSGADRRPMPGVQVFLRPLAGSALTPAVTDEHGAARVEGMPEGLVLVQPLRPADRPDLEAACTFVALCPGEREIAWPAAVHLRGRLERGPDAPAGAVNVCFLGGPPFDPDSASGRIEPAADGTFDEPIRPGSYEVWVEAAERDGEDWAHVFVHGVDPAAGPLVLPLRPAARVTGRTADRTGDHAFAGIEALPVASDGAFRVVGPGRANPLGGAFDSGAVLPGEEIDLWLRATIEETRDAVGWGVARRVRPPAAGIEVTIEPARTLDVQLVGPDGAPPGQEVELVALPAGAGPDAPDLLVTRATVGEDGKALVRGLPPMDLDVLVGGPRTAWCVAAPVRVAAGTAAVAIPVVRTVEVTGRVVLPGGLGVPDGGDLLLLGPQQRVAEVEELRRGRFRVGGLVPGKVRLAWRWSDAAVFDLGEIDAPARAVLVEVPTGR